jgi:hypothetical protein
MIKQIALFLSGILLIFFTGRKSMKDSIKNEQNEIAAKQIKRKNEIEKAVHNLDADSLDELQKRFTRD